MKRNLIRDFVLTGLLAMSALAGPTARAQQPPPPAGAQPSVASGEIIVGYKTVAARDAALQILAASAQGFSLLSGGNPAGVKVERRAGEALSLKFEMPPSTKALAASDPDLERKVLEDLSEKLRSSDASIEYAHPNWVVRLEPQNFVPGSLDKSVIQELSAEGKPSSVPNDPAFQAGLHWHYMPAPRGSNAVDAWQVTQGDPSIVVAVLDTGILSKHPDIVGSKNLLPGYRFSQGKRTPGAEDDCAEGGYHGTHVAGSIGVVGSNNKRGMAGISWKSKTLPVNVLPCGSGTTVDVADAVRWAAGLEVPGLPINKSKADVINLSLSSASTCDLRNNGYELKAIQAALTAGAVVVAAAGNETDDIKGYSPAGCPGVISVAAHEMQGRLAHYSNFGDVTIMAPGGDTSQRDGKNRPTGVWSAIKPSKENPAGIYPYQGTSMAAPHVAGAIALAMSKHPALRGNPPLVTAALRATATRLVSGACPRPCGAGYLNIGALVRLKEMPRVDDSPQLADTVADSRRPADERTNVPTVANVEAARRTGDALDGTWRSTEFSTLVEIDGTEWRHPQFGLARVRHERSDKRLDVVYESGGQKCGYRVDFLHGGETLALTPTDKTQSADLCPVGTFNRIAR